MKFEMSFYGNKCVYEDESCDEYQDLVNGFSDEEEQLPIDIYSFIGLAFHQMQQCGGSLRVNGFQIHAVDMEQTSGSPVGFTAEVKVKLHELLEILDGR